MKQQHQKDAQTAFEATSAKLGQAAVRASANRQVSHILADAQALIRKGWTQGVSHDLVDGRHYYCAIGAIREVASSKRGVLAFAALRAEILSEHYSIAAWNDAKGRTKAQVLAAFTSARRKLEGSR